MLNKEIVKRVIETFDNHDERINKKYEKIKKKDNWWSSDRDRFVGRFFKKYVGKTFILMDKEIIAYKDDNGDCGFYSACKPTSLYSRDYRENSCYFRGVPVYRNSKKFLYVTYIHAVNQRYGRGFIEMACQDILDRQFHYVLDYNTLLNIQFREISDEEFDRMADLFRDDRDDRAYRVTRYLSADEMKARKKSLRKGMAKETVTVMAKDAEAAYKKCTNAIDVETDEEALCTQYP